MSLLRSAVWPELRAAFRTFDEPFLRNAYRGRNQPWGGQNRDGGGERGLENLLAPFGSAFSQAFQNYPRIDVRDARDKYEVEAEIPGVRKEDLKVEFEGPNAEILTIRGKVEKVAKENDPEIRDQTAELREAPENVIAKEKALADEAKDKGTQVVRDPDWDESVALAEERVYGEFRRSIQFPTPVDPTRVEAKVDHGLLRLTVPKKEDHTKTHEVKIL